MKMPQLIKADFLRQEWPSTTADAGNGGQFWVLARPLAVGNLLTRLKLAIGVFTGKYDALKWYQQ